MGFLFVGWQVDLDMSTIEYIGIGLAVVLVLVGFYIMLTEEDADDGSDMETGFWLKEY